jgi:outer membrane protease
MKHPLRPNLCLALLLLATACAVPAFTEVTLTASAGTGVMYGVARELVYDTYLGQSALESELDWDLKPLFYARSSLALNTSMGFVASLDVRLGVPVKTGSISDSDWLNYYVNGDHTQTNYSLSDCYSERAIVLEAQAGWDLAFANWLTVEPFLAFGFMDFKWSARDGYLQYPTNFPGNDGSYQKYSTYPTTPISGVAIIYEQTYFIPSAGLTAKLRFGRSFSATVSFTFSPQVFCTDVDNHVVVPSQDFYDYMWNGFLLEPRVSFDWQVFTKARLSFDVSYRHIANLQGVTDVVLTGVGHVPGLVNRTAGGAGASFDSLDASIGVTWAL